MMRAFVGAATALGVVALLWLGESGLETAIDRSVDRRTVTDIASLAGALDRYKHAHGVYPATAHIGELANFLVPGQMNVVPTSGIEYFSDGKTYWIVGRRTPKGPYSKHIVGFFEVRDGNWVSWPDYFTKGQLEEPVR